MAFEKDHKLGRGRPKGMLNKKTVEMEAMVAKFGKTPLEVMLLIIEEMLNLAKQAREDGRITDAASYLMNALEASAKASPYIHRKKPQEVETKDTTGENIVGYMKRVYGIDTHDAGASQDSGVGSGDGVIH